jgi:hypothetical protein
MAALRRPLGLIAATLVLMIGDARAGQLEGASGGCILYATTVDERPVPTEPCSDKDPQNLSSDPDIEKVMRALGIQPHRVRFRACTRFATKDTGPNGPVEAPRYVVSYPSGRVKLYLAPVTHELAHVFQLEAAGGYRGGLERLTSKRIELGADYLTGIVFSQVLQDLELGEFQQNLALMGGYYETDEEAHGTPGERDRAFRRGLRLPFGSMKRDYRRANEDFQANVYGEIRER